MMRLKYDYFKRRIQSFLKRRMLRAPVSVIVPTYNGEKTIAKCLDSLLGQSQKRIKIICVNDGSTDGTLEILKKYRSNNRKIKIVNQKNRGRAAARNAGLKLARTKYVMFCDDDDIYEKNMCENMINALEKSGADLAVCEIEVIYDAHNEMEESDKKYYELHFEGMQEVDDEVIEKTDASVCNKIFRMSMVKDSKISFPDGLNNEDYYFCNAYLSVSRTAFFLKKKLYRYIRREGSIMSDNFEGKKESLDHLLVAERLFDFYKKDGFLEEHRDLFWRQWVASFWASYRYSAEEYRVALKKEAMDFLDKNYQEYEPKNLDVIQRKNDIVKELNKVKKGKKK